MESAQLTEKAKQLIVEQKRDRALLVLKLRKHKEKEVVNIDGQLMSILEMIDNVEWEYANMEVLKALKVGNAALNSLHQEMSIDDVENLLAETNEAIEVIRIVRVCSHYTNVNTCYRLKTKLIYYLPDNSMLKMMLIYNVNWQC